jgi:hypothetical protein
VSNGGGERGAVPPLQVREVIASFLDGCSRRHCNAVDLGGNNGWMAVLMAGLGAQVISVEPAADFVAAIRGTFARAELNFGPPHGSIYMGHATLIETSWYIHRYVRSELLVDLAGGPRIRTGRPRGDIVIAIHM